MWRMYVCTYSCGCRVDERNAASLYTCIMLLQTWFGLWLSLVWRFPGQLYNVFIYILTSTTRWTAIYAGALSGMFSWHKRIRRIVKCIALILAL